jgi:hypothetical protein
MRAFWDIAPCGLIGVEIFFTLFWELMKNGANCRKVQTAGNASHKLSVLFIQIPHTPKLRCTDQSLIVLLRRKSYLNETNSKDQKVIY